MRRATTILLLAVLSVLFVSCQRETGSFEAEVVEMQFVRRVDASTLIQVSDSLNVNRTELPVTLSHQANLDSLVPIFKLSEGARSTLVSGKVYKAERDADGVPSLSMTVTSENGAVSRTYRFRLEVLESPTRPAVALLNTDCSLTNFKIEGQEKAKVTQRGSRVYVVVPEGVDITSLVPSFEIPATAKADYQPGEPFNFRDGNLVVRVVAEDPNSHRIYQISVSHDLPPQSAEAQLWDFKFDGVEEVPLIVGSEILVQVPKSVDRTKMVPRFEVSDGASVSLRSGERADFSKDVKITVKSQDRASTSVYTVKVEQGKSSKAEFGDVSIREAITTGNGAGAPSFMGEGQIDFLMPDTYFKETKQEKVNLQYLTLNFTASEGAKVTLNDKEINPNDIVDLRQPGKLVVTSEDGTEQRGYTITAHPYAGVSGLDWSEGYVAFSSFEVDNAVSVLIVGASIQVKMPAGSDLSKMVVNFQIPYAKIDPLKVAPGSLWLNGKEVKTGEAINVSSGCVKMTMKRGLRSTDYTLYADVVSGDSELKFTSFKVETPGVDRVTVTDREIVVYVAEGSDLKEALATYTVPAGVTVEGMGASPAKCDLTKSHSITLKNNAGGSKVYTLRTVQAKNSMAELTNFRFKEISEMPTILNGQITLFAGPEVNTKSLTPTFNLSRGAKASMESGQPGDFSSPRTIIVTSEDGAITRAYQVNVRQELNSEADITKFWFTGTDEACEIQSNRIVFSKPSGVDVTNLMINYELSPGATANVASGTRHNLSNILQIVVTSQDGCNIKTYSVVMQTEGMRYDFERWSRYESGALLYEHPAGGWSSGNVGMKTSKSMFGKPLKYPTRKSTNAHGGKYAAEISTEDLGVAGNRIAAGSLFLGNFDESNVINDPVACPRFGITYAGDRPVSFKGWYKYTPGSSNKDGKGNNIGDSDQFDIYAILYTGETLNGKTVANASSIVAIARVPYEGPKTEWTQFNIPFEYRGSLPASGLKFSIICTSSAKGATMSGAVGSTLTVDDFEIVF